MPSDLSWEESVVGGLVGVDGIVTDTGCGDMTFGRSRIRDAGGVTGRAEFRVFHAGENDEHGSF